MNFKSKLTAPNISLAIISISLIILLGFYINFLYQQKTTKFKSGRPPQELLNYIPPKHIPYETLKPPAVFPTDPILYGTTTSSLIGIIIYGDYTNSSTKQITPLITQFAKKYKNQIRVIWHHLPKSDKNGDISFEATVLSECSRLTDPAWSAHDLLINIKEKTEMRHVKQILYNLSDQNKNLLRCFKNKTIRQQIQHQIQISRGDGIDIAPLIFVGTEAIPASEANFKNVTNKLNHYIYK